MDNQKGGIKYTNAGDEYFAKRGLKKYAGVWSLWALGVGAVISGHYSGWNLGLASGGWGGMFIATIIIAIMYLGLRFQSLKCRQRCRTQVRRIRLPELRWGHGVVSLPGCAKTLSTY